MVEVKTITVKILEKEYQVSCDPDEVDELRRSAYLVDDKMKEIKKNSSVLGLERLAIMVSLNIANDLLREKDKTIAAKSARDKDIKTLSGKLEKVLLRLKNKQN